MSEQEKKRQIINDLFNAETKPKFFYLPFTKQRIFFQKKSFLRKRGSRGLNKKKKKRKEKKAF